MERMMCRVPAALAGVWDPEGCGAGTSVPAWTEECGARTSVPADTARVPRRRAADDLHGMMPRVDPVELPPLPHAERPEHRMVQDVNPRAERLRCACQRVVHHPQVFQRKWQRALRLDASRQRHLGRLPACGKVAAVDDQQARGTASDTGAGGRGCTGGKHALETFRGSRERPRKVLDRLRDAPLALGMLAQLHGRKMPGALVQKTGGTLQ